MICLLAGLGLALVNHEGCAAEPLAATQAMAAIHALIDDGGCGNDRQCRTVAVGTKACGGPELYLAWSSRNVDPAALNVAVARYRSAAPLDPVGRVSTCSIVVDPGAHCVARNSAQIGEPRVAGGTCRLRDKKSIGGLPDR